jgi:hypothetical protein
MGANKNSLEDYKSITVDQVGDDSGCNEVVVVEMKK